MNTTLASALLGLAIGGGIWLVIAGIQRAEATIRPVRTESPLAPLARMLGVDKDGRLYRYRWLMLIGAGAGLLVGLITGWFALTLVIPIALVGLPALLSKGGPSSEVTRLADLTAWVRSLSGILVGGASGLEVAIRSTYRGAPATIRPALSVLVARLDAQQPLRTALRAWADDMNDHSADMVAAALILESDRRSGGVSDALTQLAHSLADHAKSLQAIESERSTARTTARFVAIITVLVLSVVALGGYMAPYGTPEGQFVFLLLFVAYMATLLAMRKFAQGKPTPRFLPASSKGA
jgi:Flp pilus assembly protein TadB